MRWLVALLVAGCCPLDDEYADIERDPPAGAAEAIRIARDIYVPVFDSDPDVRVRWTVERMDDGRLHGALRDCQRIWVYIGDAQRISETALAHELAHCYAGQAEWCGLGVDNSHSEEWIWTKGGLVTEVEEAQAAAGL